MGPLSVELRGGAALEDARRFLLDSKREELVAIFGRTARTDSGLLFLAQATETAPEHMVWRDKEGLHWKPELTRAWSHRAEDAKQGVLLLHAHPHAGPVGLSNTDRGTCTRILDHFETAISSQAHGYGVIGNEAIAGWFVWEGQRVPWTRMKTVACPIRIWAQNPASMPTAAPAMSRQVAAITEVGQARMAAATVALIGVGGAGSTVADQMTHMGVGRILICEADVIRDVNLSRQTGAGPSNVGALKAEVAAAAIRHANPAVSVVIIPERFPGIRSHVLLREVDVIVSCVDSAAARHEINKFSRRFLIPVVDVGATIRRNKDDQLELIAGHTARILPDGACLECEGLTTSALRESELDGHGVPYWERDGAPGAPQIMSINGLLASLAATEILRLVGGLSEDRDSRHWRYEALEGEVYARESMSPGCPVCDLLGHGDD
ncbi:MAG: HesA/MoeB/ThiF family protein [Candidatus Dormibacteraceae bacterium]